MACGTIGSGTIDSNTIDSGTIGSGTSDSGTHCPLTKEATTASHITGGVQDHGTRLLPNGRLGYPGRGDGPKASSCRRLSACT